MHVNKSNSPSNNNEQTLLLPPNTIQKLPNSKLTFYKLIALTIGLLGLQFIWAIELSYGSPYILSMGFSKPVMSLVWLAGPLSGLIVQPFIGVFSDNYRSRFGKRRPFIVTGSVFVFFSLLLVSYSAEIASLISSNLTKPNTFIGFYVLDFSINGVQASLRALIIDTMPYDDQSKGNAFASRMIGIGNLLGYFFGSINLLALAETDKVPAGLRFLLNSQFKCICLVGLFVYVCCIFINCWFIAEEPTLQNNPATNPTPPDGAISRLFSYMKDLFNSIKSLPQPIQQICNVQFFAWFSWFPFLFYCTTWFEEIFTYAKCSKQNTNELMTATKTGSLALLFFSCVSFIFSILLPYLSCYFRKNSKKSILHSKLNILFMPKTLYIFSSVLLAVLYLSTYFVDSAVKGIILISFCGISWAIFMWVPFSMIGEFIALFKDCSNGTTNNSNETESFKQIKKEFETLESGTALGIHNVYVVSPQLLISGVSSIVFYLFNLVQTKYNPINITCNNMFLYPVGFLFRLSSLPLLVSAYLAYKIKTPAQYKQQ